MTVAIQQAGCIEEKKNLITKKTTGFTSCNRLMYLLKSLKNFFFLQFFIHLIIIYYLILISKCILINILMRKQLDLNNLLSKYENGLGERTLSVDYLSPKNQTAQSYRDYYPSQNSAPLQPISNNFQMSKSECEQFLYRIREELKKETKNLKVCSDNSIKHLAQKFQRQHESIRRQILLLLDQAFRQNQNYIKHQLSREIEVEPYQFIDVKRKISFIEEDLERVLSTLKSSQYRKAIAQVVLKDYSSQLNDLRLNIANAKDRYISNLCGVEIDRSKIECIGLDVQKLFIINKSSGAFGNNVIEKSTVRPYSKNKQDKGNVIEPKKSFFNFIF